MPILGLQLRRQCFAPSEADRPALDINQQPRTIQWHQSGPVLEPSIGHHQQALLLRRETLLPHPQPSPRFSQRRQQRCPTSCAKPIKPMTQSAGGLQPLNLPLWRGTTGRQQGQPGALAIGVIEQLRKQPLGIAQGVMPTGRRRCVDNHQPQFMRRACAQVEQQILTHAWATIEQGAGPIDRAAAGGMTLALFAVIEPSGAGSGIRPRVRSGANA